MIGRITACLLVVPTVCLSRTVVAQGNSVSAYTAQALCDAVAAEW
jgi:hypothetical protein